MSAWEDGWIYTEDKLPPMPKSPAVPMILTMEKRDGKRKSVTGIYIGNGKWKLNNGESSYRIIAWRKLPKPALGKVPKFLT